MTYKVFNSSDTNVKKFVFEWEKTKDIKEAIAEAVLYRYGSYQKRTVICCSVASGCNVGCSFCLLPGTKVLMEDLTYKNIEDVIVKDRVISNLLSKNSNPITDYATVYIKSSEVTNTYKRTYSGDVYKLYLNSGKTLTVTKGHKLPKIGKDISRTKYVNVEDLSVGDEIYSIDHFNQPSELSHEWKIGWLFGFIHGDGVLCERKDKSLLRWLIAQSNRLIYLAHDIITKDLKVKASNIMKYKTYKKDLFRFEVGHLGVLELLKIEKQYESNPDFQIGYISGFWDAEGYSFRNNSTTRVCNTDINLINKVQTFLKNLGYKDPTITKTPSKDNRVKDNYIMDLHISSREFLQKFSPLNKKKLYIIKDQKARRYLKSDSISKIEIDQYKGYVYNIETTEKTYIASDVVVHNCGTGRFFIRNLSAREIIDQVDTVIRDSVLGDTKTDDIEKFQIMFMSMGEPMQNYDNLEEAIKVLNVKYPNAQLLVSTSAPQGIEKVFSRFIALSQLIDKVGLQFSVHESLDENRAKLIPTKTCTLRQISTLGNTWAAFTNRKPFYNYCVHEGNNTKEDAKRLLEIFDPRVWECTLSVICEKDESVKSSIDRQLDIINEFQKYMLEGGASLRVFNPAGQDDIGGGCGQLWYFQEWLQKNEKV